LETSAAVKLYKEEKFTRDVEDLLFLALQGDEEVFTSRFTILEMIRAMQKAGVNDETISRNMRNFKNQPIVFIDLDEQIL